MDRLDAMRAFVETVAQGSLAAAGKQLGKSSPTMVRTLAELESALGVVLLRRTTRRMSLTPEGQLYLEHCRRILADVQEVEELLSTGQSELRGKLRVTAPVLFGRMHVVPVLTEFVRQNKQVEVELLLLDRVVSLVEEGVDIAIRIGHLPDSSMIAVGLGALRLMVCASPDLLVNEGAPRHPSELSRRTCVRFAAPISGDVWRFREDGQELPVRVQGSLRANHVGVVVDACVAGLGFGRFLSYQVEPALREGKLRAVLEAFEPEPVPVRVVYAESRMPTKRLRAFVDLMKARLRWSPQTDVPGAENTSA